MIFLLIPFSLIVGTAFLIKNANNKITIISYVLVLIAGFIDLISEELMKTLASSNGFTWDGGIVGWCATIFGIYSIVWSIFKLIKFKKKKII